MTEIQPLSHDLIRRFLDEDGGEYEVDEDGDFGFEYERDSDSGCELTVYLSIIEGDTYSVQLADARNFPRSEWDRLVWLCNTWNDTEALLTAYLHPDDADPNLADIRLEHSTFFGAGITQRQLNALTEEVLDTAFAFWEWMHDEHNI